MSIVGEIGLALVILLGTSSPLLTRLASKPSQVSTHFYRVTTSPGGLSTISQPSSGRPRGLRRGMGTVPGRARG